MDVAVACVAKARDRQPVLLLQPFGEAEQVLQSAARNHNVLVELGQAGVAQRVGKLATQLPEFFATFRTQPTLNEERFQRRDNLLQLSKLKFYRALLTVQLNDEMSETAGQQLAAGSLLRSRQSERVGHLQRAGQNSGGENRADGAGRSFHRTETNAKAGA